MKFPNASLISIVVSNFSSPWSVGCDLVISGGREVKRDRDVSGE